MSRIRNAAKKHRCVPVAINVASIAMAFPAFAEGATPATDFDSLLVMFSVVTAWLWKKYGPLLTWILSQPTLLAAVCLFFAGAMVTFFMRIYHQA